jgi:hypothetical protein
VSERRSRFDTARSSSLGGLLTVVAGVGLLVGAFATAACTARGCRTDNGLAFSSVSVADWMVYWRDACNGCGADLTPVLVGVALLVLGVAWFAASAMRSGATVTFDFGG